MTGNNYPKQYTKIVSGGSTELRLAKAKVLTMVLNAFIGIIM